jgi:hypothetical protein
MPEKVLTKKSFIGGRLAYPGEIVDVDEKGEVLTAPSTPIGQMSPEQIEAYLRAQNRKLKEKHPQFGDNVADPEDANTGEQRLEMAPFRPGSGAEPQGLPPGTEPHGDRFVRPAPEGAPAAIEVVVGPGAPEGQVNEVGGGVAIHSDKPVSAQNKAELIATAQARGVEIGEDDTKAEIVEKLNKAGNA